MTITVLSAAARPFVEAHLPAWVEPRWYANAEELMKVAPEAEIGWFDGVGLDAMLEAPMRAANLKWLNTFMAGIESWPLAVMRDRGVVFTNGTGVNDIAVAEYALLGMLVVAKGYRDVVRAQDRHEWLNDAPGKIELHGTKALIVGAGAIGKRIGAMLAPFQVEVTEVRRTPAPGALGPDEWRARLGEFDWIIITVPATAETENMFSAAEFDAMKPGAAILNFSRGTVIDQDALMVAARSGQVGGAFLDVTEPEPLPADHPLWTCDNVHISQHLSGRSQRAVFRRGAERFLQNLELWKRGEPLLGTVDYDLGY